MSNIQSLLQRIREQTPELTLLEQGLTAHKLDAIGVPKDSPIGVIYLFCDPSLLLKSRIPVQLSSLIPYSDERDNIPSILNELSELEERSLFAYDTWEIPREYIVLTSCEGEGAYLYNKKDHAVYDFSLQDVEQLVSGDLKYKWNSFYNFMDDYLPV